MGRFRPHSVGVPIPNHVKEQPEMLPLLYIVAVPGLVPDNEHRNFNLSAPISLTGRVCQPVRT